MTRGPRKKIHKGHTVTVFCAVSKQWTACVYISVFSSVGEAVLKSLWVSVIWRE